MSFKRSVHKRSLFKDQFFKDRFSKDNFLNDQIFRDFDHCSDLLVHPVKHGSDSLLFELWQNWQYVASL